MEGTTPKIPPTCASCLVPIPCKDLVAIPCKEISVVAKKEVALVPNKEVATVPNKEVMTTTSAANEALAPQKPCIVSMSRLCSSCHMSRLPKALQDYIEESALLCQPDSIYICDGSLDEYSKLLQSLKESGMIQPLEAMKNW